MSASNLWNSRSRGQRFTLLSYVREPSFLVMNAWSELPAVTQRSLERLAEVIA